MDIVSNIVATIFLLAIACLIISTCISFCVTAYIYIKKEKREAEEYRKKYHYFD